MCDFKQIIVKTNLVNKMDKGRGNNQEKGEKGESNLEKTQNKTERLRLDSYVNIEDEDIPIEENEAQEGNQEKKTNNKITGTEDHYPCGVCGQDLGKGYKGKSVLCMGCQHWCHLSRCSGLASEKLYKKKDYRCPSCVSKNEDTPQINHPANPIGQRDDDGGSNPNNGEKILINNTEKNKVKARKGIILENTPIITGSREFPQVKKIEKRKRVNREEGTSESPEKKSEEKSPISKRTKIEDTKKRNKNNLRKNNEHQKSRDPSYPLHKKDTPAVEESNIKKCIDCNQNYKAEYTNKAEISCIICNAGNHGCLNEPVTASKGSVWMCGECMINLTKGKNTVKKTVDLEEKERNKTNNEEALKKNTENENILEYQGVNITEKDIKTLEEGQWVCDEIISLSCIHERRSKYERCKDFIC